MRINRFLFCCWYLVFFPELVRILMFSDFNLYVDPCETSLLWLLVFLFSGPRLGSESLQPERQAGMAFPHSKPQRVWPVSDGNHTKAGGFQRTGDTMIWTSPCIWKVIATTMDRLQDTVEYVELESRFAFWMYNVWTSLLWCWQEHNMWIAEVLLQCFCNVFSAAIMCCPTSSITRYTTFALLDQTKHERSGHSQYWILCCFLTPHSPKLRCTLADIRNA